ncbi:hypothetical protein C8Q79DRAFT_948006 [Trametes meyenii]|nr:hypothetical protein C8Q79DRAFT_948006 [Trametes meyenii]
MLAAFLLSLASALPLASAHASIWHPSMYGFNVTDKTFPYDNRPVSPLIDYTFDQWWFHGHLDHPPNPGDIFELPAGKPATTEIACNKGATTWFNSSEGGDIRQGDSPCPNSDPSAYHTTGLSDVKGCALAIAYKNDARQVQPEDFTVFSVNQTCVWTRFTDFQVPARMPACPEGGCTCAWFWIHSQDSGGEQNYMNGFKCNITGSTSDVPLAKPQLPRRCGADPDNKKPAAPGNCTYGAKQPFYWFQKERNNMFEGTYSPPFYTDLYNFKDGAQDDIFVDSYPNGLPTPSPNSTFVPTPFLGNGVASPPVNASGSPSYESASSSSTITSPSAATSSSLPSGTDAATPSAGNTSAAVSSSPASSSFSASTLSQTATFSSVGSSSLSPELPLSTSSMPFPVASPSGASSASPASEPASVTTSTVVSTLVVTVTASVPAGSVSASASASSVASPSNVASASAASSASSVSSTLSAGARSTIFLNGPSGSPSASQPFPSSSAPTTPQGQTGSTSNTAHTVINLATNSEDRTPIRAAVRPDVLAAAAPTTNAICKRQFRRKVALRRRAAEPSARGQPESTFGIARSRDVFGDGAGAEDGGSGVLSRISIPGLRRHRRLQERSSLWHLF